MLVIKSNNEKRITQLFSSEKIRELLEMQTSISLEIKDDEGFFANHFPSNVDELYKMTKGGKWMEYGIALIFLFIGFIFGKLVLNQSVKNYDRNLLVLAVVFFVIGSKTVVFATIDFKVLLSNIVPPFILGVVAKRYINKYFMSLG